MNEKHRILIRLHNKTIHGPHGVSLLSALANEGIFLRADCGGNGRCAKCMVKIFEGPVSEFEFDANPPAEPKFQKAMACRKNLDRDLVVEMPESVFLNPDITEKPDVSKSLKSRIAEHANKNGDLTGYGLAVDLGTNTICVYLYDMAHGKIAGAVALKNPQALFGEDAKSRIASVSEGPLVARRLHAMAVKAVDWGIGSLLGRMDVVDPKAIRRMAVVGNSTMIHLFLGKNPSSLGAFPFTPAFLDAQTVSACRLGLSFNLDAQIATFPLVSAFLGADIVATALAADLPCAPYGTVLIDIGTSCELMAVGKEGLVAASCAANPAFEGTTVEHGMQSVSGAFRTGIDLICREIGVKRPGLLLVAGTLENDISERDAIAIGMFSDMPEEDIVSIGNAAGEGAILGLFDPKTMDAAQSLAKNIRVFEAFLL